MPKDFERINHFARVLRRPNALITPRRILLHLILPLVVLFIGMVVANVYVPSQYQTIANTAVASVFMMWILYGLFMPIRNALSTPEPDKSDDEPN